jgi:hypothetical protein
MFVIWGWGSWPETLSQGNFFCPGCQRETPYDHRQMRTWGTIFFIPLIPMAAGQRFVQCRQCQGTFIEDVLNMFGPVANGDSTGNAANREIATKTMGPTHAITGTSDADRHNAESGERVLGQRGRYRYPGTVLARAGKKVEVAFDDGECDLVSTRHVSPLQLRQGDPVFARRDGNFEYEPGNITALNDNQLEIRFADGRQEWAKWADIRVMWQEGSQNEGIAS